MVVENTLIEKRSNSKLLIYFKLTTIWLFYLAGIAQLVEQLICNQ